MRQEAKIAYPHVIDVQSLDNPDPLSYKGQHVLGVGFTRRTGLGYVMGVGFAQRGAELTVGGSSEGSVLLALRNYQKRDRIDPNMLGSFPADLTDSDQIDRAVASLKKPPTIVAYASATGMEGFFLQMSDVLQEMRTIRDEGKPDSEDRIVDKKRELRENLAVWVPEHLADALAVNTIAPEYLVDRLVDRFGEPFKFVYVNSTFGFAGKGPIHYSNVYTTKHQTSLWLTEKAGDLASKGVDVHEEVDPDKSDTDIGETIMADIAPFWSERVRNAVEQTAVERQEVLGSVLLFTGMTPEQRAQRPPVNRHFLVRESGTPTVFEQLPKKLDIANEEFDF